MAAERKARYGMNKRLTASQAADLVKEGNSVMIGGFLGCGAPEQLIDALMAKGFKNLTLIANDTGFPTMGPGRMVAAKLFSTIYASHIGTNKETGRQMVEGETVVHLVPQGTLVEQIRAAGYGLGGFLTRTGVGTEVEKGKTVMEVDGVKYLLEKPLHADISLVFADKADEYGNLVYRGATRNFNPIMASAASITIAQVREIVPVGRLDPNEIIVPGAFVNHIVQEVQ